eukprot:Sspe_Gene.110602::Locus_91655_Transcript_1_1_Confidence_1.000_Length_692::g.110602::m.110602
MGCFGSKPASGDFKQIEDDDYVLVSGAGDLDTLHTQLDRLTREFSKDIKGGVKGDTLTLQVTQPVPRGDTTTILLEIPPGFPSVRPRMRLIAPKPEEVKHGYIGKDGILTFPALEGWRDPAPLSTVVKAFFAGINKVPFVYKSARVMWSVPSRNEGERGSSHMGQTIPTSTSTASASPPSVTLSRISFQEGLAPIPTDIPEITALRGAELQ